MEMGSAQEALLPGFLAYFDRLFGDRWTRNTFAEVVKGIISAGSLACQRIAQGSPRLSAVQDGEQRESHRCTHLLAEQGLELGLTEWMR